MRFVRRAFVGIFLMAVSFALIAQAGATLFGAMEERRNAEPRSFPQRERVIAANVVRIEAQVVTPELVVHGELRSRRVLAMRSAAGGIVVQVSDNFVDGGRVTEGEVLVWIDPVEPEAALARVQADLHDAQAEARDADRALILAQDELAAAQAQAALRVQALARQRDLQERGIGTAPELEAAELTVSSAQQAILSRRQAIAQAEARIDQAITLIARTRISFAEAERTLAGTKITAAFDGTLSGVVAGVGARVTPNEQIAELIDPAALEAAFRVSTSQYANLLDADGQLIRADVVVSLDVSGLSLSAPGQISRESAGGGTGQIGRLIYANIAPAPGLRPGDFVTVTVSEPPQSGVALLPATALAADGTVLMVGEGDRLQAVPVVLLRRQGNDILIDAQGLEGERVVAQRSPVLGAGLRIRPVVPGEVVPGEPVAVPDMPSGGGLPQAETTSAEMIQLTPERRARLTEFVTANARMPAEAKTRILDQLAQPEVPADVVERLESRMGS
ncbi:MAG: efflux transporter periplasmic adaptor subunit [Rhodobacteraceae bacterium]|nr:efflux transporter periplasmic adaptor subunit [Paracoccaceae bacterium]